MDSKKIFLLTLVIIAVAALLQLSQWNGNPEDKLPMYIANFGVSGLLDKMTFQFSLLDDSKNPVSSDGTLQIYVNDEKDSLLYQGELTVKQEDFQNIFSFNTESRILTYSNYIPVSKIQKGFGLGTFFLKFLLPDGVHYFETNETYVWIPNYTYEEIIQLNEEKFLDHSIPINMNLIKNPFEITVLRVGNFTQYTLLEERDYFRVDVEFRNIYDDRINPLNFEIVLIDEDNNQYTGWPMGTLFFSNIYPNAKKEGYVVFPRFSSEVTKATLIFSLWHENKSIYWEFDITLS